MEEETPMVEGAVDYKNRPALRSTSGGWASASFIIGVEIAERFAYYGVSANLITYLTGPLGESTAVAASNVNAFNGAGMLLPLFGALVADTFLGRFRTILYASLLYTLALGLLTFSTILPSLLGSNCETSNTTPCSPPLSQAILFFSSLYLIAIAQGGHRPCTQAFGADQFDGQDPSESNAKSSFFNWWYFGVCAGSSFTKLIVVYVQDNFSWALGFGIPCIMMLFGLFVFMLRTKAYRYAVFDNKKNPFSRIGRVFIATIRNRRAMSPAMTTLDESHSLIPRASSEQFEFIDKALIEPNEFEEHRWVCSTGEVEEAKAVLRLIPIWTACLIYGIVFAQNSTFFTKQGATMERTIVKGFKIPAASLQCIVNITIVTFIPIYDRFLVKIARAFTGKPSGITMLQRIGIGIFISVFSMITAALVETRRLKIAEEHGLVDDPSSMVPMSVWWLVPQYVLFGIMDVFTMVGLQEFFYDQVPNELRSVGIALYLSVFGIGSFLSGFMVSFIDKVSSDHGGDSWFSNNLNKAHLDYFYWLLAGLSALGFAAFLHFSRLYVYIRRAL